MSNWSNWFFSSIVVAFVAIGCCSCFDIYDPKPTPWPQQFTTNWKIYYAPDQPPYADTDGYPSDPIRVGSGLTYYDWSKKSMIEQYFDFCANGSNWKCHFLNTQGVSYLVMFEDRPPNAPPCCVFENPWYPPAPNFIENAGLNFNSTTPIGERYVNWWVMEAPEIGGPFGYGFYNDTGIPAAFYFGAVNGWTEQYFHNFLPNTPPSNAFDIPASCVNAPNCTIWG